MNRSTMLDILGYTSEQIAEAEAIREAERVNQLMHHYAVAHNTLEGFSEYVAMHDAMVAGE